MQELRGVKHALPLPRLSYAEAMERFGSDKPDLRYGMELKDINDIAAGCGFSVFKNAVGSGADVSAELCARRMRPNTAANRSTS